MKPLTRKLILLSLATLLTLSAVPALAAGLTAVQQKSGTVNLDCITFKWQVQGPDSHQVAVILLLSGKQTDSFVLTAQNPYYRANHRTGSCPMTGDFGLINISKPGHGTFEIAIVVEQGGHVNNYDGPVANW